MKQKHAGRVTLILVVTFLALMAIFPLSDLFNSSIPWTSKLNLKPGIDIAGGTSLLYQIKLPPGQINVDLPQQVAASLKKRVDPDGVKGLIWRPLGTDKLEIQMPRAANSEQIREARQAFAKAQQRLEDTNLRSAEINSMLAEKDPAVRESLIQQLGKGSPDRIEKLKKLVSVTEDLAAARQRGDQQQILDLEDEPQAIQKLLEKPNLSVDEIQKYLAIWQENVDKAQKKGDTAAVAQLHKDRDDHIQQYISDAPDNTARTEAINNLIKTYDGYAQFKGSVGDAEDLKRMLMGSGMLEFHILVEDFNSDEAKMMIQRLHEKGPISLPNDTLKWFQVDRPEEFPGGNDTVDYEGRKWVLASIAPADSMVHSQDPSAKKWGLQRAYATSDPKSGGQVVGFEFDAQGSQMFGDLSGANIKRRLAIMLDEKCISAPTIQSRIEGSGVITGQRSEQDRNYLISTLNAGSLPASLESAPISERTVSPSLGSDNLRAGLVSCLVSLVVVAIFMVVYYHLSGLVAAFALLLNMVLILGAMAMFNATFTLPGIAALVLTVGTSVDANVLVFERLREEQHRGLSLRMAIHNAYNRAFTAILDSNVITIITSVVLYSVGSEEVRGFGLTLLIGILCSLFTALFVTRTIFNIWMDKFGLQKLGSLPLSFPKWDAMLKPKFDWVGHAWIFYIFSAVVIIGGLAAFFARGRNMFDIEFASGTSVEFQLKKPMPLPEVRKLIEDPSVAERLRAAQVVSITMGAEKDLNYEVVTTNTNAAQVKQAVLDAMGDRLNIERKSDFAFGGTKLEEARGKAVFVVDDALRQKAGLDFTPAHLSKHLGGGAIVLKNLTPALTPAKIQERLENGRLQGNYPFREFHVDSSKGQDQPTSEAVILFSDVNLAFDRVPEKWQAELVQPMWNLVNEAIGKPPVLQKVSNFDSQVAGDAQTKAFEALALSALLVLIYIWIRFSNFKYGSATVVAMLHDALFVLAAIGLSHVVYDYARPLAQGLLIEPFRMNMTLVAAVLTVMSYSMIDTIVVFDRIRENRGKFGYLSRQLINDSINQTLSRTLLTGGTTLMSVFVMYLLGGAGIHGFTFALLVGILVGTYSSVAIASPMLLWTKDKEPAGRPRPVGQLSRVGG